MAGAACTDYWYIGRCLFLTSNACTCTANCPDTGEVPDGSEWKYPPCKFVGDDFSKCSCYVPKKGSNGNSVPPTDPCAGKPDPKDPEDPDKPDPEDPNNPYKNPIKDVISCGKTLYECCCE